MLNGLKIVPHPLASEVRDEWKVEAHPTKKRCRNWRVVKHHIDRPGAYQMGNTIYMHPDLVAKLKEATPPEFRDLLLALAATATKTHNAQGNREPTR